jgi:hypothetical protein
VVLPDDESRADLLRPLTGATDEIVAIRRQLSTLVSGSLLEERVRPATFPLPAV